MKSIRSHFVPQFYLENFGNPLYGYDKTNGSAFPASPKNVALQRNFYGPVNEKNSNPVEQALSRLESKANVAISEIIKTENVINLSNENKINLCAFLAIQYLRTQEAKARIVELSTKVMDELTKQKGVTDWEIRPTEDGKTGMHLNIMTEYIPFAAILSQMNVMVCKNETDVPLWTSDNPVTLQNEFDQFPWGNLGLTSKGIEVHLPLTPRIAVVFFDPVTFQGMPTKYSLDKDNVIRENYLQTIWSTRFLYSNTRDFYLAKEYLSTNPQVRDQNKERISMGFHQLNSEELKKKKFHEKPEFWMDPGEVDKFRKKISGKNE